MSRVDDDRDAARVAARLAEAKRTQEGQKTKKAAENNAFSKLVAGQKQETQVKQEGNLARSAIAQMLEAAESGHADEAKHLEQGAQGTQQESAFKSKLGSKGQEQKVQQNSRSDGQQTAQVKEQGDQGLSQTANSRQADQSGNAKAAQGRSGDAKVGRERLEERKEAGGSSGSSGATGGVSAKGEKGDLKTDSDKGGGQQGGGSKDGKDGAAAANPGFRFNPALMAPMSVAKPKEATGSERLRKVANELAQKIVEKVRIGTNAMGKTEFQIDLKGDVLAGLSVKVSAKNGKISAVFSGSDKDVLKLIEEQGEALKAALGARGLTLEDFKTEAR
ncbi:MAG: flagellar hook-length control protein FliK [Archangium sp.]|nr:flagellar hook-length control protein FliK [Archangium sp.]MDP3151751.1 flagellar hook-length control protein FliK [Archangium sp.]MDP3573269.1 flagellar hook-length control protein FliK [Archangium sp.]